MSSDYTFCLKNPLFNKQGVGRPPTTKRSNLPKPVHFNTIQQQDEPTDDVEEDRISRKIRFHRVLSNNSDLLDQTIYSNQSKLNLKSPSLKILNSARSNQQIRNSGLTFGNRR